MRPFVMGFLLAAAACTSTPAGPPRIDVERRFATAKSPGCAYASPLAITTRGAPAILVVAHNGRIDALDPASGKPKWTFTLPANPGEAPNIAATPAIVGSHAVLAWQSVVAGTWNRVSHHVAMLDLESGALDPAFPILEVAAHKPDADGTGEVAFLPAHEYSRSTIQLAHAPGHALGRAYLTYGNIRDLQPWHGWVFEVDLDAWKSGGADRAISGVLLTTPESACGATNENGADEHQCGGGVWAPSGIEVHEDASLLGGYELLVPTGNGVTDVLRHDYGNALLRVPPGLAFDDGCDPAACANFDGLNPSEACLESCANAFIPRLPDPAPDFVFPKACAGETFLACYATLDWDLGADTPARVKLPSGREVEVLPAKDGGVYLLDAKHLGTMLDRQQLVPPCGNDGGTCSATWAGTMVTQPVIVSLNGAALALVQTFVFDNVHPAGLVALELSESGGKPHFVRRWEAPAFSSGEAKKVFRRHPGRVGLVTANGDAFAAVVEVGTSDRDPGTLWIVRVSNGNVEAKIPLTSAGQRFVQPLVTSDALYVTSCDSNDGPGKVEAFSYRVSE